MIPSILARQLQKGIGDYVATTFPMTNVPFKDSFTDMLREKDYLYHEPYVSIRLPFRSVDTMPDCFEAIQPAYMPYVHQARAFERLTGKKPESTLVATGTGSGKTECFLYPILDYCYKRAREGKRGVKALIIYPMNALASDQSRRIAELIYGNPKLKDTVTAGIYVGSLARTHNNRMTEDQIITDRETMRNNPPDILLTNYKMLDYLLIRPDDAGLWSRNEEDTLKFIVVDEFHTFDGAQGTDLACLLRRLKKRLGTPENYLCCIGTSATMGDKSSDAGIRSYASQVFGEPFASGSVITESRLTGDEFLDQVDVTDVTIPGKTDADELEKLMEKDDKDGYIKKAASCWLSDFREDLETSEGKKALGHRLMHLGYFQSLIRALDGHYFHTKDLISRLQVIHPEIKADASGEILFDALLALISCAKNRIGRPFLDVNVQLWLKELRRLEAKVSPDHVEYALANELNVQQAKQYLPVVNCRDCGATGWASRLSPENGELTACLGKDLSAFYNLFFDANTDIALMYPYDENLPIPEGMRKVWLCPKCLHVKEGGRKKPKCHECGTFMMSVLVPDLRRKSLFLTSGKKHQYICPFCGSERGISLMGLRSATEISAEMAQLFASNFNDDRKLLAFSDSVQDAAQRAGFFNSRTWRFCLRMAIQKYVLHLDAQGEQKCLKDFMEGFLSYWHGELSDEDFIADFIAPNMVWMRAYQYLVNERKLPGGQETRKLIEDIENRLKYEILLEYGRTSHIGRTLEKSGNSALAFHLDDIAKAAAYIRDALSKDESFKDYLDKTNRKDMEQTVLRFLNTMKFFGAFTDPTFDQYLENDGNPYLLSTAWKKWRPGRQSGRNIPRFIAGNVTRITSRSFDHVEQPKYMDTIVKKDLLSKGLLQRMTQFVLDGLVQQKLVTKKHYLTKKGASYDIYGINEEKVYVSSLVSQLRCDICGSVFSAAGGSDSLWEGAKCLRKQCTGHLHLDEDASLDYYHQLYENGTICRINAREHTGLLDNEEKIKIERDFKRDKTTGKPFDPNVLSCTPTLEMGIDIGDLDTVILCSMPPAQAQFLQRCGRAGRKDGNAFVAAVANARPHDLYFYADPLAMIDGQIDPPKIFLKASAVLERQLIAYCLDCWVKTGLGHNDIPDNVGACLVHMKANREKFNQGTLNQGQDIRFPFNFLYYVQNHLTELLSSFEELFSKDIDDSTKQALEDFAKGTQSNKNTPMQVNILKRFEELEAQKEYLESDRKDLKQYQAELAQSYEKVEDSSLSAEIKETQDEIDGLTKAIKDLQRKNIYGFMADEGLLPNYAFPEEGMTLRAVFTRKMDDGEGNERTKAVHYGEYNRAASNAIREFAPMNTFYADGHKMTISRVDVKTAKPELWRLCPNCSHAEPEQEAQKHSACPSCHCPDWADSGQKVTMLRPQIVYSSENDMESLIDDGSEDRATRFYEDQMLVDVMEKDIVKAYEMDNKDFNFGYEFARKAVLREINFGLSGASGTKTMVDGIEDVRNGFKICKYCGSLQPEDDKGKPVHTKACPAGRFPGDPKYEDAIIPCMYLYRDFQTEVLRILMPVTSRMDSEVKQESFTAAFMLGMKEYFGNVDHIHATVCDVPTEEGPYRKKYLVVYDSVPGGTGYLKQLMENKDSMVQIFQKALSVMENCSCHDDPQKDGCYRCLYAYRQSRNIGSISRNVAESLLRSILSGQKNIKEIKKLDTVKTNVIFDSELEAAFIEAIRRCRNDSLDVSVNSEILNGKEGYVAHVNGSVWEIEPQVHLGKADGVAVDSKPDFILRLIKEPEGVKPSISRKDVAIFTDGFTYHWDKTDDDTLKRNAIMRSDQYRVWSLSYDDVEDVFKKRNDYAVETLDPRKLPAKVLYDSYLGGLKNRPEPIHGLRAFEILMRYLAEPEAERDFQNLAKAYSDGLITVQQHTPYEYNPWYTQWNEVRQATDWIDGQWDFDDTYFGQMTPDADKKLTILSGVPKSELSSGIRDLSVPVAAVLHDENRSHSSDFRMVWNGFWHYVNVMQFSPQFIGVSKLGMEAGKYFNLAPVKASVALISGQPSYDERWNDYMTNIFASPEEVDFGKMVMHVKGPVPDMVGEDVEDDHHRIIGTMTMGWIENKVCFLSPADYTDALRKYLESQGWTVLDKISEFKSNIFGGVK